MKRKLLFVVAAVLAFVGLTAATWNKPVDWEGFVEGRAELLMREVGHRTLLYAGDSTSRVLPVSRLSEAVFQLRFERTFSFVPDSLIRIVDKSFAASRLPLQYRVSVFDCKAKALVYGFEIMRQGSVVPCQGRVQPTGCYTIQVEFFPAKVDNDASVWWGLSFAGVLLFGFLVMRGRKTEAPHDVTETIFQIGQYQFTVSRKLLMIAGEFIELSDKETRILHIFARQINQPVDRNQLMKEVWESEGIIVGRSLDVFVSRLRKKLAKDPAVKIVNIHGKGYKLEVG